MIRLTCIEVLPILGHLPLLVNNRHHPLKAVKQRSLITGQKNLLGQIQHMQSVRLLVCLRDDVWVRRTLVLNTTPLSDCDVDPFTFHGRNGSTLRAILNVSDVVKCWKDNAQNSKNIFNTMLTSDFVNSLWSWLYILAVLHTDRVYWDLHHAALYILAVLHTDRVYWDLHHAALYILAVLHTDRVYWDLHHAALYILAVLHTDRVYWDLHHAALYISCFSAADWFFF